MSSRPSISIVIPLYNEEKSFELLIARLKEVLANVKYSVEVVLVDDGSSDGTSELIEKLALEDSTFQALILSRNHGHQIAISAGLANASASEAVMIMDGDLQDPPEMLDAFYEKYKNGYDVVYGIRKSRKGSVFLRILYWTYYRFLKNISNVDIPLDAGDFALISRKVVDQLNNMPELSRFIRGMRSWVGFRQTGIEYERDERVAGDSKYTYKELFLLAYNGIFNFSDFPIKFMMKMGIISILVSLGYLGYVLVQKYSAGDVPIGFTAIIFAIVLFSGVQLISLSIIGEYLLRIYNQVRNRPMFIVHRKIIEGQHVDNIENDEG